MDNTSGGELPLVDVNSDTVSQTWPLLLLAVKQAHFISLDLEFSGLGSISGPGKGEIPFEERYRTIQDTVNSRAVLSIGVACFQWREGEESSAAIPTLHSSDKELPSTLHARQSPSPTSLTEAVGSSVSPSTTGNPAAPGQAGTDRVASASPVSVGVQVFNVWLMCKRPYTIDPSSAAFLLQHGFDFNKQFAKGIPYTPGQLEILEDTTPSLHSLFATILATGKPIVVHNGWLDILFLYGTLYAPLPPSLGTLMADLEEMFEGGVYDTKAIAEYEAAEQASFLEYLFRKSQRENDVQRANGCPHLHLQFTSYPSSDYIEMVSLFPSHTPSLEDAMEIMVCPTFARAGYCHTTQCASSHDVLVVLAQHEYGVQQKQLKKKRKRKREHQKVKDVRAKDQQVPPLKQQRTESGTVSTTSEDSAEPSPSSPPLSADIGKLFAKELEAARLRVVTDSTPSTSTLLSPSPKHTSHPHTSSPTHHSPTTTSFPSHTTRPSFGHRAGFDAFMTGHTFAYYAITLNKSHKVASNETIMTGLSSMKNRLNNSGKKVPLIIAKSQFAKTSQAHRTNWSKITDFKKQLFGDKI